MYRDRKLIKVNNIACSFPYSCVSQQVRCSGQLMWRKPSNWPETGETRRH